MGIKINYNQGSETIEKNYKDAIIAYKQAFMATPKDMLRITEQV